MWLTQFTQQLRMLFAQTIGENHESRTVTKIDKSRLYKGAKGTYLDLTTFVDTAVADQYENNGFISQSLTKEEREAKEKTPILGNVKVFYTDSSSPDGTSQYSNTRKG